MTSWFRRSCTSALACAVLSVQGLPAAHAESLHALYRLALARDPGIAAARAQVVAAQERVFQARAAFGPTANASANLTETRYREAPAFDLREFRAKQATLQVTQPLLRPALYSGLDAALAQATHAQAQLEQLQAEAGQRLAEACFEVLKARDTLVFVQAQEVAVAEQLALARRSFRVGTVAVTDVREAEAQADAVAAQLLAAETELELRQQVLAQIARTAPGLLSRGLTGERLPAPSASPLPGWLAAAAASPRLRQAQQALHAAQAEFDRASHAHAPTLDLTFNHSRSSDTGTVTSLFPRRGDATAVGLSLNVPLFASGSLQSKIREALALRDKAQGDLEAAQREIELELRRAYAAAVSAVGQARALETALRSQELAVRANRRAYEVGMKVGRDVLESQSRLFEVRRDLSQARYDAWLNQLKLQALGGQLQEAQLLELDALLVEQQAPAMHLAPQRGGTP